MEKKRKQSDSNDFLQNQQKKTKVDCINYISIPQLECIATINVVIELCKLPDVRDVMMYQSRFQSSTIVNCMLKKLSLLPLSNLIKAKVVHFIRPILMQILDWLYCIRTNIGYDVLDRIGYPIINSLCWTSQGTVDKVKTLKQLIEANYESGLLDNTATAESLYELACTYCLYDILSSLWEKLPQESKWKYLSSLLSDYVDSQSDLMLYWSSVNNHGSCRISSLQIHRQEIYIKEHSIYKNMFSISLDEGNILAIKFFWEKLTDEEIICNIDQWINEAIRLINSKVGHDTCSYYQLSNEYVDILFFLMSKLSSESGKKVIQKNSYLMLQSLFLFWPYEGSFLPTIKKVWDSLDEKVYLNLVYTISRALETHRVPDYKFVKTKTILSELCLGSPQNLKKCFVRDIIEGNYSKAWTVLCKLLKTGDMETVREMMSHANVEETKKILEKVFEIEMCEKKILQGNFDGVDQFIQQTALSEADIINFKEKIGLEWGSYLCQDWISENAWEMVENFLKWTFTSEEKICYFRYKVMDGKIDITFALIKGDSYEDVNRFINWCFDSEQEINQFKKNFAFSKPGIVKKCQYDWRLFEKFIAWSSLSEDEINAFKQAVKQYEKLGKIICDVICNENFQFVQKLMNWFCSTSEEIQEYKAEYVLSIWFFKAVTICDRFQGKEALKRLMNLFLPLTEEIKIKLKEKITKVISCKHLKKHLFCLLDDDTEDE